MEQQVSKPPPCGCESTHLPDLSVWWCGNPTYKCTHCRRWFRSLAKATDHVVRMHDIEGEDRAPAIERGAA